MHLLILGGSHDHPGGVEAFCDRSIEALKRPGGSGWRIERIFTSTAYLTPHRMRGFLAGILGLIRYRREKPDCVWLQYHNLPDLSCLALAKLLGMYVVVTPHLGANWRSQSNPVLRSLSGLMLRLADRLALLSKTQEQEINLPAGVPRSLIRTFLPDEVLTDALPDRGDAPPVLQIVHSGRLSEGKGTFKVVAVCAGLRDLGLPFHARIIGGADESTYAKLAAMIAEHGLGDRVEVIRWLPVHELLGHLRQSDVLVHLSSIDSYPLIVLEAAASGMVPVCVDLAGARDMVDTYGGRIVPEASAVEDTIGWLAAQDLADLRRRGRAAAIRVRADYRWDRCIDVLEDVLRLCGREPAKIAEAGRVR